MVRTFLMGKAGVSVLAAQHGVTVRVLDLGVDDDLEGVAPEVTAFKVRRGSGAIHLEDALTTDETLQAIAAGEAVAAEEIAAGAQLLISGDMGIGNTTPAAALIAASLGLPATEVTGRGTGIDEPALVHKMAVVQQALDRAGERTADPVETLIALGSADLAGAAGFMTGHGGTIVNISSGAATLGSPGEYVHYAAAKAGVDALTLGLGKRGGAARHPSGRRGAGHHPHRHPRRCR